MQRHAEVAVGVVHGGEERANLDAKARFLQDFPPNRLLKRLARLALAPGELPEAAEHGGHRPLGDQELASAPDQADGDVEVWDGFLPGHSGELALLAEAERFAEVGDGAGVAGRGVRRADGRAQLHHRLVEVARPRVGQGAFCLSLGLPAGRLRG